MVSFANFNGVNIYSRLPIKLAYGAVLILKKTRDCFLTILVAIFRSCMYNVPLFCSYYRSRPWLPNISVKDKTLKKRRK